MAGRCYIVDAYGHNGNSRDGEEFYMGTNIGEANRIYNILANKIEPEYTELTDGVNYDGVFLA